MAEGSKGLGASDNDQDAAQGEKKQWQEEWEDEDEEESQLSLEALRVLDRLKDIDCPFLEGFYITGPKTIKEFLCTPSIYRLGILEWLFIRLYPPFGDSIATVPDPEAKEKIRELTKLGNELMLCGPNDQDLIKGCTEVKDQLCFFNKLIDLVTNLGPEYASNFSSVEENLQSLPKDYKMLLKKAFDPSLRKEVLDPKLNPLPADTDASRRRTKEDLHRTAMESKKSKVEELSDKLTKLTEMLQTHKEEVFSQKDGVNRLFWPNPTRSPEQGSPLHGKMSHQGNGPLGLILSDFHQLVTAFIHVFENELQDHCHRPAPHISPCGLLFQSVYETLTLFLQELKAVNEVTNTSEEVETKAEKPRREKAYLGGDTCMVTLVEKMKELKRIYEIFQDNPHTAGSKDGS
ncbi:HAUS augmin-like complex subunit 7 [Monodelphis domestica]|uniref:HAUS augmin-like complex subunit 7 n=1 Tax=Monodelphis domestica TaxID=13616 RepID=UPI0024E1EF00|nr:HAUS augmin-like complex subunit 7 [Monodelphis domestica]